jgi:transposase
MGRNKSKDKDRRTMSVVHPNAAAIDVGATMHVAAVNADRTPEPVRSFGTFTTDLHRLVDWFAECGVDTVVMESTSVYWIPIFELLDARGFAVFLVNARDAKHVPGRKTDVSDAQWLQRLHSFGLLRASFRPKGHIAELRAYLRQRERLLQYGASHIQHMQKALTEMNVQLHHVVTDIYRCDRAADHPHDPRRRAQSGSAGAHAGSALPRHCRDDREGAGRQLPR